MPFVPPLSFCTNAATRTASIFRSLTSWSSPLSEPWTTFIALSPSVDAGSVAGRVGRTARAIRVPHRSGARGSRAQLHAATENFSWDEVRSAHPGARPFRGRDVVSRRFVSFPGGEALPRRLLVISLDE